MKHDEAGDSDDRILYYGTWISFHVAYRGVMNHELVFAIFVDCFLARSASLISWTVEEATTTTHPCKKNTYICHITIYYTCTRNLKKNKGIYRLSLTGTSPEPLPCV